MDAGTAVELAEQWVNIPSMESGGAGSGQLDLFIPDAPTAGEPTTISNSITLAKGIGFVEFVEVTISLRHQSFRDLEIELVSPTGSVSRLAVPHDTYTDLIPYFDFVPLYGSFRFGSARHLGEDPNGDWTLRVTDRIHAGEGALESWAIRIYGHKPKPDSPEVDSATAGPGSLAVAWTAPAQTSDFEVTSYDLRYRQTDAEAMAVTAWTRLNSVWTSFEGGNLEYEATGLIGGSEYEVQVRSVNRWGPGDWSDVATGTPENAAPSFGEGTTTTRSVIENTPAGEKVGDPIEAYDDDSLTYGLAGPDASLFVIDSSTGQMSVGTDTTLDFESGITEFAVVTATDQSLAKSTIAVVISVIDVSLGTIGDRHDADHNEVIDGDEVLGVVRDYFSGLISGEEVLEIVRLYFSTRP